MRMIGDERPSKTIGLRPGDDITQAFNKIIPVLIIGEYSPTLDSTNNNMMQGSGSIDACFAWHKSFISQDAQLEKLLFYGRPQVPLIVRRPDEISLSILKLR
jgi:hypothetical protein